MFTHGKNPQKNASSSTRQVNKLAEKQHLRECPNSVYLLVCMCESEHLYPGRHSNESFWKTKFACSTDATHFNRSRNAIENSASWPRALDKIFATCKLMGVCLRHFSTCKYAAATFITYKYSSRWETSA